MSKQIKFTWSGSDHSMTFQLDVQLIGDPLSLQSTKDNDKIFSLDDGKVYEYDLQVTGPVGGTYSLAITGAKAANTPATGSITLPPKSKPPTGPATGTHSGQFTA